MAKLSYEFDPLALSPIDIPSSKKEEAIEAVADLIKEQVLLYISEGKSPVAGGPWKRSLSKAYKERKGEESSVGYANLELSGDLLDHLDVVIKGNKLSLEVKGSQDVVDKAEGNNIGSYGKDADDKKARRFIPIEDETFRKEIISEVRTLLGEYGDSEA